MEPGMKTEWRVAMWPPQACPLPSVPQQPGGTFLKHTSNQLPPLLDPHCHQVKGLTGAAAGFPHPLCLAHPSSSSTWRRPCIL